MLSQVVQRGRPTSGSDRWAGGIEPQGNVLTILPLTRSRAVKRPFGGEQDPG